MPMSETTADILATEQELANKMYMEGYAKGKKDADDLLLNMLINLGGVAMEDIVIDAVHETTRPNWPKDPAKILTARTRLQAYASVALAICNMTNPEYHDRVLDRLLGIDTSGRHSLQRDAGEDTEPVLDASETPSSTSTF